MAELVAVLRMDLQLLRGWSAVLADAAVSVAVVVAVVVP
jgi:hypothetical protein